MEDLGITSPSCFEQETDKVNQLYNDMREIDGKSSCRVVFQLSCSYYFFAFGLRIFFYFKYYIRLGNRRYWFSPELGKTKY